MSLNCHSTCRGSTSKSLAGAGSWSESCSNFVRGLPPPLSDSTQTHKVSHSRKLLCQSPQGQLPDGGITSAYRQKCSGTSSKSKVTRVFQLAVSSSETKQQVETYFRPEQAKSLPQGGEIQNGNTGNHQVLTPTRGMGHIHRLSGRLFPYTNTGTVQEISEISCPRSDMPVQGTALRSVHSTLGVYCGGQRGETDGHTQGYKNPPLPRRLVGESQIPPSLSPAYPSPSTNVPRPWLGSKFREIRTDPKTSFQLCGVPVRPPVRPGPTHTGLVAGPTGKDTVAASTTGMSGPAVHVPDRLTDCHRKASTPRSVTYETHPVASQKQLGTRITGGHSNTQDPSPSPTMVAGGEQCAPRSTITPNTTCSANIYRRIKRRVGRSLRRTHCKRVLVPSRKQTANKLYGTKSSLSGLKRVPGFLYWQNSSDSDRQHYSSVLHKQGRGYEVGPAVCPSVENLDLVHQETCDHQSTTHSRPFKRGSGQTVQARPNYSNRMVAPSRVFSNHMQQVAPSSSRPLCHEVQQQVAPVCIPSTRLPGHCSRCTQSAMGGSGCICLPTGSHSGQGGGEVMGLSMQENDTDCSGVAQHPLVLGPSNHVQSDTVEPSQHAQPANTAFQSDPSQESDQSKSPCMAPRATAIKEQGFSKAVAARIEAPQRGSTRSVYEAKWTIFTNWCITNQVEFRAPPVKSVADFLMYLFEDRKLQPSTIDGYRSAIADKLGNSTLSILDSLASIETDPRVEGVSILGTYRWSYTS